MTFFLDLLQIILIDLSMAGDNVLVVGGIIARLPVDQRKKAMTAGIAGAAALRIAMAFFAVQLLHITGLLAAGGLLLLWVGWKMLRAAKSHHPERPAPQKLSAAVWQIIITDISLSLDNVLGVAGVARDHNLELVIGLILSVALVGIASTQIARLTTQYPKLIYLGIAVVLFTAARMIYDGLQQFMPPTPALF